jgi:beta-galactosidase
MVKSDDGSRLFLNNELVINHWGAHAATEKSYETRLDADKEVQIRIEYNELSLDASVIFGWMFTEIHEKPIETKVKTTVFDKERKVVTQENKKIILPNHQNSSLTQQIQIDKPHLWDAKTDPYLYTVNVQIEDIQGKKLDEVEQLLGIRFFNVDKENGLILNGRPYPLYGVTRHQEWEGVGSALTDPHHEADVEMIMEMGANGVRLAHYQQAEKMYGLCDEKGLVVWAEIPNTPAYRAENPSYLDNCKNQLVELIKQNFNHPSIFFWGLYNEVDIPTSDVKNLNETAKRLDPFRLTTQADLTDDATERHGVTDVVCWNKYFGWYYGGFNDYSDWFDRLHRDHPELKIGLSEYGAGGCISQQKENPERPDPTNGRFFPEQYQRLTHERVWSILKDRKDIWCKFIWNMFDFSWTYVKRGDRDFMNHKGLVTHDRKVKKDTFYFYKANWSDEPVLYILSRRNTVRKDVLVPVEVYTNLDAVELVVNGALISTKKMDSDIHKMSWENVRLAPGRNQINVIGYKENKKYTDACEWTYYPE